MKYIDTDIDIDFADRNVALSQLPHIDAMIDRDGKATRHPSGVYFQNIPVDPLTDLAAYDYEKAPELGFIKVDFLNNSIYACVRDEEHLERLMAEPDWDLFLIRDLVEGTERTPKLAHVGDHFGLLQMIRPRSVEELAICVALIRPGKCHLIGKPMDEIKKEIWLPTTDYYYKKPHAIAYAMSIIVQVNLIVEQLSQEA